MIHILLQIIQRNAKFYKEKSIEIMSIYCISHHI